MAHASVLLQPDRAGVPAGLPAGMPAGGALGKVALAGDPALALRDHHQDRARGLLHHHQPHLFLRPAALHLHLLFDGVSGDLLQRFGGHPQHGSGSIGDGPGVPRALAQAPGVHLPAPPEALFVLRLLRGPGHELEIRGGGGGHRRSLRVHRGEAL